MRTSNPGCLCKISAPYRGFLHKETKGNRTSGSRGGHPNVTLNLILTLERKEYVVEEMPGVGIRIPIRLWVNAELESEPGCMCNQGPSIRNMLVS